ncbi:MAG: hypothetical protein ACRYGR_00505 [Janthinobacterium lividum]
MPDDTKPSILKVTNHTIILHRKNPDAKPTMSPDGKVIPAAHSRMVIDAGTSFKFTQEEVEGIVANHPGAIRDPISEDKDSYDYTPLSQEEQVRRARELVAADDLEKARMASGGVKSGSRVVPGQDETGAETPLSPTQPVIGTDAVPATPADDDEL